MEVRYASNSVDFATFPTQRVRDEFLVQHLFVPGKMHLVYSHYDRLILGGAHPTDPIALGGGKELGTAFFLERREMGVVNVGPAGSITVGRAKIRYGKNRLPVYRQGLQRRGVRIGRSGQSGQVLYPLRPGPCPIPHR